MSTIRDGLSAAASDRIRSYWILLWALSIVGFGIIFIGFALTMANVVTAQPWDSANPAEAVSDDGGTTWHGTGNAVLRMTEAEFGDNLRQVTLTQGRSISLFIDDGTEAHDEYYYPDYIGGLYDYEPTVLFPLGRDLELWIRAEEPWQITFSPVETLSIDDRLTGEGEAFILYRGNATSASVDMLGDGVFSISVLTPTETSFRDSGIDELSTRLYWEQSPVTIIKISSSDPSVKWVVDMDLLADDVAPSPSPTEAPDPSETANAPVVFMPHSARSFSDSL